MLEDVLVNYQEYNLDKAMTFQQDNAGINVSKASKTLFASALIPFLGWPARSPDLNLIENLWVIMSRDANSNVKQYNTVNELKTAILQFWQCQWPPFN